MTGTFPDIPAWVDPSLSGDIPVLRASGEGQRLEYMESFPQSVWELAKEIAALATSDGGTVLIGVDDTGDLKGIPDLASAAARDQLVRRLEGICHGTIKPPITPAVRFAVEAGHFLLVLDIPKGDQPLYYVKNTPYLRHVTQSRPAEPNEVIEIVADWLRRNGPALDPQTELASSIIHLLSDIELYLEQLDLRVINPYWDQIKHASRFTSEEFRRYAAHDVATAQGWRDQLLAIADVCGVAATIRPRLGPEPVTEMRTALSTTIATAIALVAAVQDAEVLPHHQSQGRADLRRLTRELQDFAARFEQYDTDNRLEELQGELGNCGRQLRRLSGWPLQKLPTQHRDAVRSLGTAVSRLETLHMEYGDGGAAIERLRSGLSEVAADAAALPGALGLA